MEELNRSELKLAFNKAKSRLLFFDFDKALMPIETKPGSRTISTKIKEVLTELSGDSCNQVVIISGRTQEDLDHIIGDTSLLLVAEHGGFFREPNGKWIARFPVSNLWKPRILPTVKELTQQYAGSSLEEKHYSISWHYHFVQRDLSETEITKIISTLRLASNKNEFVVDNDNLTIDIRSVGIDKGKFAAQWIWGQKPFDFILAMGDSKTDEDLFEAIGPDHFTIKIGNPLQSSAQYYLCNQDQVNSFLSTLIVPLY